MCGANAFATGDGRIEDGDCTEWHSLKAYGLGSPTCDNDTCTPVALDSGRFHTLPFPVILAKAGIQDPIIQKNSAV